MLPPGRVVSAQKPAAMRMWMTYPMTIVDTIFKALAPAIPDKVIAGHHADLSSAAINGRHPRDKLFHLSRRAHRRRLGRKARRGRRHATIASMTATPITARASRSRRNIR